MKLILLRKVVLPINGPGTYNKEAGNIYPILSTPANDVHQAYPAISWVNLAAITMHLKDGDPNWLPFKQKRLL